MTTKNTTASQPIAGGGTMYYDPAKRLWVGTLDFGTADGTRRRVRRKAKTKPALLAKIRELQATKAEGRRPASQTATTGAWLHHWSENVITNRDLAPKTVASYQTSCRAYLIPHLGHIPLARLSTEDVEAMMAALRQRRTARGFTGLKPGSVAVVRRVLRMALAHADLHGKVTRNVAALVKGPRETRAAVDDGLDAPEAAQVLETAKGDRLEALAVLALATGMRQGECLKLRWDALDLDDVAAANLTVRRETTKSDAGARVIALPPIAVTALRAHKARQAAERLAAPAWEDTGLVFTGSHGEAISPSTCLKWWHELTIRAGVGRRRFHASRHTAATLMLNNGVRLEVVSKTLGHANIGITADVYAKVRAELQRTAADAMQNVLGGAAG